jgi:hypothetical protein
VSEVDPRLVAAMREQLSRRPTDADRVGWKYGSGEEEHIGGDHVVGHLTSATLLADGDAYRGGGTKLQADVEVAVEVGDDLGPARYGVALEVCDVAPAGSIEEVVIGNDYHRAVAFGHFTDELPPGVEGALLVNGERRAAGRASDDLAQRVAGVDRVLRAVGEELRPGDRVITGLVVNTLVRSGDDVVAELGELGSVRLTIA